jgi:hypothetical protein
MLPQGITDVFVVNSLTASVLFQTTRRQVMPCFDSSDNLQDALDNSQETTMVLQGTRRQHSHGWG